MTERSLAHGSFTVKRRYPHPVAKVFGAWADPALKRRWYGGEEQDDASRVFEFRNGGREYHVGKGPEGNLYRVDARYYDIVENNRIVYAYDVRINGALMSVSIATVAFGAIAGGTELTMTEHGAFLDGHERPEERPSGTEWVLDRLGEMLAETN